MFGARVFGWEQMKAWGRPDCRHTQRQVLAVRIHILVSRAGRFECKTIPQAWALSSACVYVRYDLGSYLRKMVETWMIPAWEFTLTTGGTAESRLTDGVGISSVTSCKGSRVHSSEGKYCTSRAEKEDSLFSQSAARRCCTLLPVLIWTLAPRSLLYYLHLCHHGELF